MTPGDDVAWVGVAGVVVDPRLQLVALSDLVGPAVVGLLWPDKLLDELDGVDAKLVGPDTCAPTLPRGVPPLMMVVEP